MEHKTVLLSEAIKHLNIKPNGVYVDCTLGGGGHAEAILLSLEEGHLFAFDQDEFALNKAKERLFKYEKKVTFIQSNFANLKQELNQQGIDSVDGVLFDLGVSSFHFDDPERGFSYQHDAELDMRMNQNQPFTAKELINTFEEHEIKKILYRYADERFAPQIARKIAEARKESPIRTTFELVDIIKSALPNKVLRQKGHPAKKTFQALRIAVNDELHAFETSLKQAIEMLNIHGRVVVISFHSLEDRIAKHTFRDYTTVDHPKELFTMPEVEPDYALINKKIITPSEEEITLNNRAHSAKMRVIEKIK